MHLPKILIIGGASFIGKAFFEDIALKRIYDVTVSYKINYASKYQRLSFYESQKTIIFNENTTNKINELVAKNDIIFYFAGVTANRIFSEREQLHLFRINVDIPFIFSKECQNQGKHFIYLSSQGVANEPSINDLEIKKYTTGDIFSTTNRVCTGSNSANFYLLSKQAAEFLLSTQSTTLIVRLSSVYGVGAAYNYENSSSYKNKRITKYMEEVHHISLLGKNFTPQYLIKKLNSLKQTPCAERSYIYIDDAVLFLEQILTAVLSSKKYSNKIHLAPPELMYSEHFIIYQIFKCFNLNLHEYLSQSNFCELIENKVWLDIIARDVNQANQKTTYTTLPDGIKTYKVWLDFPDVLKNHQNRLISTDEFNISMEYRDRLKCCKNNSGQRLADRISSQINLSHVSDL